MKTVAIIQARAASTRLPQKIFAELAGRPVIEWVVRAATAAPGVDMVVVATSTEREDDAIVSWCTQNRVPAFRGSQSDVLGRFAGAIHMSGADVVVRLTADCPFLDPIVIGQTVRLRTKSNAAYASNIDPPTWPDGLDCEVVTTEALLTASVEAHRPSDREHVTPFVRNNRSRFPAENLVSPLPDLYNERWTLDTPHDLQFLSAIAQKLPSDRAPSHLEVLAVLDREPSLRSLNGSEKRNSKYISNVSICPADYDRKFTRSEAFLTRAESVIPLASQTFSKSRIQLPPNATPLFVTHGDGGKVYDLDGNEYVDLISALLPNVLGYRDADVDAAIRRQLNCGISFSLPTMLETELAERLVKHVPCAEMVRFGKNGTDATSGAVRLARAATRRDRLIMLGYHGWQDWYIGATSRNLGVPKVVSALSHMAPWGDLDAVRKLFLQYPTEFAAVIIEPANLHEPPTGYLQDLKELTHQHGALLIFDEIVTGFRWSLGGAQARYGVVPDLACFGKAMGNGMPISAVVGRTEIMRLMEDIFFSATFGGESLSIAAAIATIDKIEREGVIERLWEIGEELKQGTRAAIAAAGLEGIIDLVGAAPWTILTYRDHAKASKEAIKTFLLREMIAAGVLISASHNVCFAHTASDIALVIGAYQHALSELSLALTRGDIERRLGNRLIRPIFSVRAAS